jgi:hypothetical protein
MTESSGDTSGGPGQPAPSPEERAAAAPPPAAGPPPPIDQPGSAYPPSSADQPAAGYPPPPAYTPPPVDQPPSPTYPPPPAYSPSGGQPPAGSHSVPPWGGPGHSASGPLAGFDPRSLNNFDAKTVNPLDWVAAGVAFLALVFSFFSWYHYSIHEAGFNHDYGGVGGGFTGALVKLLLLIGLAAVVLAVLAPQMTVPVPIRLVGAAALGLATLLVLLKLLVRPRPCFLTICAPGHYSPSIGLYLTLVAAVVATVVSFLRFQQTGGQLPGRS